MHPFLRFSEKISLHASEISISDKVIMAFLFQSNDLTLSLSLESSLILTSHPRTEKPPYCGEISSNNRLKHLHSSVRCSTVSKSYTHPVHGIIIIKFSVNTKLHRTAIEYHFLGIIYYFWGVHLNWSITTVFGLFDHTSRLNLLTKELTNRLLI